MRRAHLLCASALVGITVAAPSGPAAAQAEEIVVTARKREESLRDVPVSGTVLDESYVDSLVLDGLEDYLKQIPAAVLINAGPAYLQDVSIRGQGGGRNGFSESATGVYRNGIFAAGGGFGGRFLNRLDLFDAQRVEVFRGPQGALYGRNAVGGAINVVSNRPAFETEYKVTAKYESTERIGTEFIANLPILSDSLAVRAGLLYDEQNGGFIRNLTTGNIVDTRSYLGLRLGARYVPSDNYESILTLEYYDATEPAFATIGYNTAPEVAPSMGSGPDAGVSRFQRRNLNREAPVEINEETILWENTLNLDVGDLSVIGQFKNRTGSRIGEDLDHFTPNFGPASDAQTSQNEEYTRYGVELRLASPDSSSAWTWLIGADAQFSDDRVRTINSNLTDGALMAMTTTRIFDEDIFSYSGFGLLGYDLTERLNVSLEARVQTDHKDVEIRDTSVVVGMAPTNLSFLRSRNWTRVTPVATARYEFNDQHSVYGRVATGYRPGGYNEQATALANPVEFATYEPEYAISYELGWKGAAFGFLSFETAGYYTVTNDVQLVTAVPGASSTQTILVNGGDSLIWGLEAEARARFDVGPGNLVLNIGASTVDGQFSEGSQAQLQVGGSLQLVPLGGVRVNRTRDYIFNATAIYTQPIPNTATSVSLTASFQAENGGYENAVGDVSGPLGVSGRELQGFGTTDFRASLFGEGWRASAYVRNAFNDVYRLQEVLNNQYFSQPRTFGGELNLTF